MAVVPTLQIGDPMLKAKNTNIQDIFDQSVKTVIGNLIDSMRQNNLVGMAAPQIGENLTVFVTEPRETPTRPKDQTDELRVYINPTIIYFSPEEIILFEGCGSVLNGQLFGPVKRSKIITIQATDQQGKQFELTCDGILARVIQHEYDHLFGIEFLEKISDYKQMMTVDFYIQNIKPNPDHIKNSTVTQKNFKFL